MQTKFFDRFYEKSEDNPKLLASDESKLSAGALSYHYFWSTIKFYDGAAEIQKQRAAGLISLIEKEYDLKTSKKEEHSRCACIRHIF